MSDEHLTAESDPKMIRRRVAILHAIYEAALTGGPGWPNRWQRRAWRMLGTVNPKSRVDWHAADVLELANKRPSDLLDDHNAGRGGESLALLVEIADEEGWS